MRDTLLADYASNPYLTVQSLGTTPGGQQLKVATITDQSIPDTGKFRSYVIAQQHAGEVPSSWNAEGLIRYLLSNDATAAAIRRNYIFKIIPIVNVDGVYQGISRYTPSREGVQYDLNRDWTSQSTPEIQWIWNDMVAFQPDSFNDMHSTVAGEVGSSRELLTYTWSTSNPKLLSFRSSLRSAGFPETVTGVTPYACTVVHNSAALGNIEESVSWENPDDEISTQPGVKLTVDDWMTWGANWAKGNYLYFGEVTHTLIVNTAGSGSVTKNPDNASYPYNSSVQLTAVPITGWHFKEWSGDLTGTDNSETILINDNKIITATFEQNPISTYTLNVNVIGSGSVAKNPNLSVFNSGDSVQLTAAPSAGYTFTGWSGDLTGSVNPTTITMNAAKTVTATFTAIEYTLSTSVTGSGSVAKSPSKTTYHYGDVVQLTATPITGWSFSVWSGDVTGSANPASITVNGNKAVTATFTQNQYTLM